MTRRAPRVRPASGQLTLAALRVAGVVAAAAVWLLVVDLGKVASNDIPPLVSVVRRLVDGAFVHQLLIDSGWTFGRWFAGLVPAAVVGAALGIFLGSSRKLFAFVEWPLDFLRSLPVVALFPIYLVIWGVLSENSKRAMVFTAAVFPILLGGLYGVRHAKPARKEMARVFGGSRWQIFWHVSLPEALPGMWVGFRTSLSLSLVVTIVSEFWIGGTNGLGIRLFEAYARYERADMFAYILVLGGIGTITNLVAVAAERWLLDWTGR